MLVTSLQLLLLSSWIVLWNTYYISIGFLNYYCTDGNSLHMHFNLCLSPTSLQDVKIFLPLYKNQWTLFFSAKAAVEETVHFPTLRTRMDSQMLFFNLVLVLIPSFNWSTYACFHLSLWNSLVYNFRLWKTDHACLHSGQADRQEANNRNCEELQCFLYLGVPARTRHNAHLPLPFILLLCKNDTWTSIFQLFKSLKITPQQ